MLEGNETIASGFAETREDDSQTDENVSLVNVKVGNSRIIQSKRSSLIAISGFFESMLALKPEDDETIDLTSFCNDEKTLLSLVLYANYASDVTIQWSDETNIRLLFLSDPLQFCEGLQEYIMDNVRDAMTSQQRVNDLILFIRDRFAVALPSELQIEAVLAMLIRFQPELSEAQEKAIEDEHRVFAKDVHDYFCSYYIQETRFFNGHAKYQPLKLSALMIFALWLREMHVHAIFVPLVELKNKYDVRVGSHPPEILLECDDIVPGLLHWIRVIYA